MDDAAYLAANPNVARGLSLRAAAWAFTARERSNWHPVTWLSHQLDVTLFGLRPGGHHLVGLLLHAGNALLLFATLRGLTGALWRPALVAALFAVHPLHVESVAWASERKDVLSTLLMLLALAAWLGHLRRRGGGVSVPTAALYGVALLAKPMPVTFPFLLLVLDWWPLGRWAPGPARSAALPAPPVRLLVEKLPLFLLAAASSAVTYAVQRAAGAVARVGALPWEARFANALVSYVRYLGKAVWPRDLAIYYPLAAPVPSWQWAGALLLLGVATAALLRSAPRRPWLVAGWFWYLGTLVPVIGLVQVGGQAMADRYTYLPLTGIFVACAWAGEDLASRRRVLGRIAPAVAVALVAVAGGLAFRQAGVWRNGETLFRHALAVSPGNWLILSNLGAALAEQGRFAEAERAYRDAIRADPFRALVHGNLGFALARQGRHAEAEAEYRRALLIEPRNAGVLVLLGDSLAEQGEEGGAKGAYRQALRLDPANQRARQRLGLPLTQR